MNSGPPGTADHLPPRQSTAYRTIATCGGIVLAIAVIGLVRVLATWPSPPPAGTTNEKQVRYGLEHAAGQYADALFAVTPERPAHRGGTLHCSEAGRSDDRNGGTVPAGRHHGGDLLRPWVLRPPPAPPWRRLPATGSNWSGRSAIPRSKR